MAKGKRKKHASRKATTSPKLRKPSTTGAPLPDPPAMGQVVRQLARSLSETERQPTPLDRAQELIGRAFGAARHEQLRLARQALEICPDCADAYVLLAEHAPSLDEARQLYEQGVAAGARALDATAWTEYAGHFWGIMRTRPYMRARQGLAECLWEAGEREQAAAHYREMLGLNPNDNQGLRWSLATLLLDLNRDEELRNLLADYKDDAMAQWAFTKTLAAYREAVDSRRADKLLAQADKSNRHVAEFLLGHRPLPARLPSQITLGGEDEAASYAIGNRRAWLNTPGAISWLRRTLDVRLPPPRKSHRPSWPKLRLALSRLPQESHEVWQVDVVPNLDEPLWTILIVEEEDGHPLRLETLDAQPTPVAVWNCVIDAMQAPLDREARRPAGIAVRRAAYFEAWKGKLSQIGVRCVLVDTLDSIDLVREQVRPFRREGETHEDGMPVLPEDLLELPQEADEVWQTDLRKMPAWIMDEPQPRRAWLGIVVSRSDELVLAHRLTPERPTNDSLWEVVVEAIRQPLVGTPHRPRVVEVATQEIAAVLRPDLEQAGIECVVLERLEGLEVVLDHMSQALGGPGTPLSLLQVPGMRPEQVGSFYTAAADFYRRQPWQHVTGDTPVRIACDNFQSGPWYAVVMGQSGVQQGLAIYEDLAELQAIIAGDRSEAENARGMSALSLMFSEAFELPVRDLDAVEQYGWTVAGPEAYPLVLRINPGLATRPPLGWELELMEACLRAIPEFLRGTGDTASTVVQTGLGHLALRLAWVE